MDLVHESPTKAFCILGLAKFRCRPASLEAMPQRHHQGARVACIAQEEMLGHGGEGREVHVWTGEDGDRELTGRGSIAACAVRGEIGDGDGAWERGSPLALPAPRRRGKEVQAEEVGGVGNM